MKSAESLMKVLSEQVEGYRALLEILQREKAALLEYDAQAVEELSKEKDTAVLRLRLLEEERVRLMQKYTTENSGQEDMNLQRLGEMTGQRRLLDIRSMLVSLLQSVQELNRANRSLIDRSLLHVRNSAGFFDGADLYSVETGKGKLVSEET